MGIRAKHHGGLATCILMFSIISTLGYIGYHHQFAENDFMVETPMALPPISVPSSEEVRTMRQLMPVLEKLSSPAGAWNGPVALEAFGYHPIESKERKKRLKSNNIHEESDYALTFTFSSGTRHFCIIDGVFYSGGGTLPDGATIVRISPYKVLIRKKERQIWIPLSVPDRTSGKQISSQTPMVKADIGG